MSVHTFRQRAALARLTTQPVRPAAPWWLWTVLTLSAVTCWCVAIAEWPK